MATGFHKPKIDFLPDELFPEGYEVRLLYQPRRIMLRVYDS